MNVYLLGAGASKSYEISKTNERLPLAVDFFTTFNKLKISANGWVIISDLIGYVKDKRNISFSEFSKYNEDIEKLHTEIQEHYLEAISKKDNYDIYRYGRAYSQLISLFCSVINEIQNGDESEFHKNLVLGLDEDDVIITFNWDTLIDKSLRNNTDWTVKDGYSLSPEKVYCDRWVEGVASGTKNKLLKLHGSTNWISSYISYDFQEEKIAFQHAGSNELIYIYESTIKPYPCYDGRYMAGYEDFSMGYYPPNIPSIEDKRKVPDNHVVMQKIFRNGINPKGTSSSEGIVSLPIIIPPVKNKSYEFYGNLFPSIWKEAEDSLADADNIYVLGYSFPATDKPSTDLFKKAFSRRSSIPNVVIVNPNPDEIVHKFTFDFGIPKSNLRVFYDFITSEYVIQKNV